MDCKNIYENICEKIQLLKMIKNLICVRTTDGKGIVKLIEMLYNIFYKIYENYSR